MKNYRFHTVSGRVIVKDDELVLPASHRARHWHKAVRGFTVGHPC